MDRKFIVSSSPHIRTQKSTQKLMADVIIALLPTVIASTVIFGFRALGIICVSVICAVLSEYLWCRIFKKNNTVSDCSAVITGILLAFTLPVSVPLFVPALGSIFAIIVVKELFGGLGNNFINPALAGRAFLLASFPNEMTTWYKPFYYMSPDAVTSVTPLRLMKSGEIADVGYLDMFLGNMGGCIGEVCALSLIIGFIYLLIRGTIKPYITLAYVLSMGIFSFIFGYNGFLNGDFLTGILTGGVMLGAVFMLTDYVTSPTTKRGNIICGVIAALITVFIRLKGGYPEGVCYSILLVNILAPQIDKFFIPKKYGYTSLKKEAKKV